MNPLDPHACDRPAGGRSPDAERARADLAFIREVVARTQRRIDPHAFHYVHWGAIVLVWFPLGNLLSARGRLDLLAALGAAALLLGAALSVGRELRLRGRPRLAAQETFVAQQVRQITAATIGAGLLLSALAPATGFVAGPDVPIIWGFVYATLASMIGVVYERDFRIAGAAIFVASLVAVVFRDHAGYVLGPVMGLGMIVPGLRAEARVRAMEATGPRQEEPVGGDTPAL